MDIELNDKNYTIPDNINDIPVSMFHKIIELEGKHDKNTTTFLIEAFCILAEMNYEFVLEFVSIDSLSGVVEFLNEFFTQKLSERPKAHLEIAGEKYYLGNNDDLLTGEYIDLEAFINDGLYKNISKIAALLYKKEGERYEIKSFRDKAELFDKELSIGDLYGSLLFFYHGKNKK